MSENSELIPMRQGPFQTCVTLPKSMPKKEIDLRKLHNDVGINLKEADDASRPQTISLRNAGLNLAVLGIYLLIAFWAFPKDRFFKPPVRVALATELATLLEPAVLASLPARLNHLILSGQFFTARLELERDHLPAVDEISNNKRIWNAYLFLLYALQDETLEDKAARVTREAPDLINAHFFRAVALVRQVDRNRSNPGWFDGKGRDLREAHRTRLQEAIQHLEQLTDRLSRIPANRRSPAQSELLRLSYLSKAEAYYLLWIHDPLVPKTLTEDLKNSFRYLNLADPKADQADVTLLRIQIGQSLERKLDWGFWDRNTLELFGEEMNRKTLHTKIRHWQDLYDEARSL